MACRSSSGIWLSSKARGDQRSTKSWWTLGWAVGVVIWAIPSEGGVAPPRKGEREGPGGSGGVDEDDLAVLECRKGDAVDAGHGNAVTGIGFHVTDPDTAG